jgi:tRNA nucleotidyltransferase (CCA-adding enzyme)
MSNIKIPNELAVAFSNEGHELWLVGGCVRDHLLGIKPKDIDFATSATPDEQVALYDKYAFRYIATGLQHGTITVVLDEPYEITTFRIDVETDGRHAEVEFTNNIELDLARRDLTINAMAMNARGEICDPFGGQDDIRDRIIRFVGDANARIQEDYLRILRFFRFYARYDGATAPHDQLMAIRDNINGLGKISHERIWAELAKIVVSERAEQTIKMMIDCGVFTIMPLVVTNMPIRTDNPVFALMSMMTNTVSEVKWLLKSVQEQKAAQFFVDRVGKYSIKSAKIDLVNGEDVDLVNEMLRVENLNTLLDWVVPIFPLRGDDFIARGIKQGRELGVEMKRLRDLWIGNNFEPTREFLLDNILVSAN